VKSVSMIGVCESLYMTVLMQRGPRVPPFMNKVN
jgi:hypothetical protein